MSFLSSRSCWPMMNSLSGVHWKPPNTENDPIEQPVWQEKETNLSEEDRSELLTDILRILPRIGQEESLAISVLRILVILTRDHSIAKKIGERQNLQCLFVMAKQLCGVGSARLKQSRISDSILIILRHIVEDEETIRQMMASEIRLFFASGQRNRSVEIHTYLRHLAHVALRSPKLFIETTYELVVLSRWSTASNEGPPRQWHVVLKGPSMELPKPVREEEESSVEPTVQATEDWSISDVKPSTESETRIWPMLRSLLLLKLKCRFWRTRTG